MTTHTKPQRSARSLTILCVLLILPGSSLVAATPVNADGISPSAPVRRFDILIRNGWIVDGEGSPRYRADLAINGDEIVAIGRFPHATAVRVIDANGHIITPGFFDMHAHVADGSFGEKGLLSTDVRRREARNFVAQGITTAVANPDGYQSMPLPEQRARLESLGIGLNVVLLNGHSGLRREAMHGDVGRAATIEEIRHMRAQVQRDLEAGDSFGMSLGVEYDDARYSSIEEQLALGAVLAQYNGIFSPHLRSQGPAPSWYQPSHDAGKHVPTLDDALQETLRVAEETGAIVVLTHMKARGRGYRGEAQRIVRGLEAARQRGARVYMDVYPYDSADSDSAFVAIPSWMFGKTSGTKSPFDYAAAFERRWTKADARQRAAFKRDLLYQIDYRGGVEGIRILDYPRQEYIGKTFGELMRLRNLEEMELAIALQVEGDRYRPGGALMRSFSMDSHDIETFYQLDWCAMSTDGWIVLPEEAVGANRYVGTHQRLFGSYPRRLRYFSQERGVDSLEHAVRSASGLPSDILSIHDRGRLAAGMKADIVVLDLEELKDNTSYLEPSVYPGGIEFVLINGQFVVDGGRRTTALPGRVLRRAIAAPATRCARETSGCDAPYESPPDSPPAARP